jgi:septal ring factor EnvC (AmiA/AmiB activator)
VVDRVYKGAIPDFRSRLEKIRKDLAAIPSKTDWNRLRVEPLLRHVKSLEAVLKSKRHSAQISRLTRGVSMFHSDLVYLQHNVKELEKTLGRERRSLARSK